MNTLPSLDDINARIDERFGEDYMRELRALAKALAKPVNPLRDATPEPWDTTPFPADVEL